MKIHGGKWKKIPIFVVSNSEGSKTIKAYVELGISKYYVKSNHRLDEIIKDIKTTFSTSGPKIASSLSPSSAK